MKCGNPLAFPGIAFGSEFPPPVLFSASLSGPAPVAKLSHGLTPRLGAWPVGHFGLQAPVGHFGLKLLLVGADSGACPSPVGFDDMSSFRGTPWLGARRAAQGSLGLSAFTKEGPSSLNRGEAGGEEVRLRAPWSIQPENQSHTKALGLHLTFPKGRDKIKDRERTLNNLLMILWQVK